MCCKVNFLSLTIGKSLFMSAFQEKVLKKAPIQQVSMTAAQIALVAMASVLMQTQLNLTLQWGCLGHLLVKFVLVMRGKAQKWIYFVLQTHFGFLLQLYFVKCLDARVRGEELLCLEESSL